MSVIVNVIAEHAIDQLPADVRPFLASLSFTTSTTEPRVIIEKTRNASHCTNRGDLVSEFAIVFVFVFVL